MLTRYDKAIVRRLIRVEDIADIFGRLESKVKQWIPLAAGTQAIGTDVSGNWRHMIVRPAGTAIIRYSSGNRITDLKVRLPNLLAVLQADNNRQWSRVEAVYAFGGQVKELAAKTQLYVPPLPNMYEGGNLCMGSVELKKYKGDAAEVFEQAFIKSIFTGHSLDAPLASRAKWRNIIDAIKKTRGRVPLSALRKVKKYGEIFKDN